MYDTANLNRIGILVDEEQPVVANTQAQFFHFLERLDVALA
jgi:hypothetical protein